MDQFYLRPNSNSVVVVSSVAKVGIDNVTRALI